MDFPAQRRDRLRQQLESAHLDAFVISHPINVTYLTGFSGEASVLIVGRHHTILVSDFRFIGQLAEECPGLATYIRPPVQKLPEAVGQTVDKLGVRAVGFENHAVTVAELQTLRDLTASVEWQPAGDRVETLRMVKDESEIVHIREAIRIAENAYVAFQSLLRPSDTEKDLSDAMESYVRRAGGRCTSFPTIVAVAERAALPHAPPTSRTVATGELLLIDWGASGAFYKSDLTRTVATRKISTKLEEVYAVVLKAQQQAIRAVRPGAIAQDIDAEARGVISQAGFGSAFGHGLGHGIGLQVHEGPAIRPGSTTPLEAGMVFTVEPGIYLPGWGGVRIEDDVMVTPDGCQVLTQVPRGLVSLSLKDEG